MRFHFVLLPLSKPFISFSFSLFFFLCVLTMYLFIKHFYTTWKIILHIKSNISLVIVTIKKNAKKLKLLHPNVIFFLQEVLSFTLHAKLPSVLKTKPFHATYSRVIYLIATVRSSKLKTRECLRRTTHTHTDVSER